MQRNPINPAKKEDKTQPQNPEKKMQQQNPGKAPTQPGQVPPKK